VLLLRKCECSRPVRLCCLCVPPCDCSCDVHLCSVYSAHANRTVNIQHVVLYRRRRWLFRRRRVACCGGRESKGTLAHARRGGRYAITCYHFCQFNHYFLVFATKLSLFFSFLSYLTLLGDGRHPQQRVPYRSFLPYLPDPLTSFLSFLPFFTLLGDGRHPQQRALE
jgi:hypothetical protein